ncbi:sugar ABC transporter substrate-binding protein [Lysinibacillus sp. FSL K6-0057]|uniref:sugar ABC transporter substrate-binding protein n=1 Tax=Lysinibacillus TaxID=400634 RepID=UPI0019677793|nr:sugar ABC transporter substrate-binding protein [Lysinibacillus fusiformis]QSB08450.1 sugar ABC transporter substrate-binding protein [Lysinibacillus fusiformis]
MKKVLTPFLSFALVSSLFLAACNDDQSSSSGSNSDADKNVSVVLKTTSSPYWKYVEAGAKKAGEDLGINVTIVGPSAESEVIQQVNMLEDQISQSPDAILISPTQPDTVIPALERAAKDIPVVLIDSDATFNGKTTFIGTENFSAGQEGGKQLANMLQKGDKVVLISGALGNPATDERIKGAKAALEEAGMVIVSEQPADSDKTKAMSVMENILEKDQDIKGVFSANDDMALGVLRAVQAKNLDIKIFGTDGTEEAVKSILDNGLTGTVAQNPYNMGYQGVETAVKAISGESIDSRIDSGITIITKENAQEHLDFLKSISK